MKFIDTKTHGFLDYLVGMLLIVSPWLFDFYGGGTESWVPVTLGVATILYSLLTEYELGISSLIPIRSHLLLDFLGGVLLTASPWLFHFSDNVYVPHVAVGVFEVAAALLTKTRDRKASAMG